MAVAAPARRSAPAPRPSRTTAPPRRKPARAPQRKRATTGQLIPLAVGRTAVAVSQLPDSGLVVRLTRGRAWIGVLGVLLVGIVALNVVTLSFAASSGRIDQQITALDKENSMLSGRVAERYSTARVRSEAAERGLVMPTFEEPRSIEAGPKDVTTAAARLAAAGG
jgi:hypothetical protein